MSTHSLRLALIIGVIVFNPIAQSATFQVGNAAQLIAAIDTANGNGVNDTIILGADISLAAVNNANILGVNGLPVVTADGGAGLDLEGNGHTIARAVDVDNFRILQVAAGANLSLHRVTLANGSAINGGGIYNLGTLTLDNVTFSGNSASTNGGGLANDGAGTASVTNVTFLGNSASNNGGGLVNLVGSTVTLTNVTFSDNTAQIYGGGIFSVAGLTTLTNVTLSGNSAPEGQGGGIYLPNATTTTLRNTLLAGNSGGNCGGGGNFSNVANNLDSESLCGFTSVNGSLSNTDPLLGTLGNHGGPTPTIPLLAGSPAINAGTNIDCPATDQRGVKRPQGAVCDIGAYEWVNPLGPAWNNNWQILRQP